MWVHGSFDVEVFRNAKVEENMKGVLQEHWERDSVGVWEH